MEIIYVDFLISIFPGHCYETTLQHKKIIRAEISPPPSPGHNVGHNTTTSSDYTLISTM